MSRNLRVYKQSELASRDTTSPHFLYEINSVGSRPWDGRAGGGWGVIQTKKSFFGPLGLSLRKNRGGGGGMGSPSPSPGSATDKYLWAMTSSTNEFHFKQTG